VAIRIAGKPRRRRWWTAGMEIRIAGTRGKLTPGVTLEVSI
jgi:hypothetical protein